MFFNGGGRFGNFVRANFGFGGGLNLEINTYYINIVIF